MAITSIFNSGVSLWPGQFNPSTGDGNQPVSVLDRWANPGDVAAVEPFSNRGSSTRGNAIDSDAQFRDASYIRLKNLSFSWRMPEALSKRIHLRELRTFINAQNLLTMTKYKGLDPENIGLSEFSLPPLRMLSFGIQTSFSNT